MDALDLEIQQSLFSRFARLVVAQGQCPHAEYFFVRRATIGSAEDSVVRIVDPSVDPIHAVVELDGGAYWIQDLGSRHGTTVNGRRIERVRLEPDDRIALGRALVIFLWYRHTPDRPPPEKGAKLTNQPVWDADGAREESPLDSSALAAVSAALESIERLPPGGTARELYFALLESAMAAIPAERGVLLLLEGGQLVIRGVLVAAGVTMGADVPVPRALVDQVVATGQPAVASNADPSGASMMPLRWLIGVPLKVGGVLRGVLYLDARADRRAFDRSCRPALAPIGRVLGLALREIDRRVSDACPAPDESLPAPMISAETPALRDLSRRPRRVTAAVLRASVHTADGLPLTPDASVTLLDSFYERAERAVTRNRGVIEWAAGASFKAIFGDEDAADLSHACPLRAAMDVHRETYGLNLRASLTRGTPLAARVALEVGELTVRTVGTGPGTRSVSVGRASSDSSDLLTLAHPGELLAGPEALVRWAGLLRVGRTALLWPTGPDRPSELEGRAVLGLSTEGQPAGIVPQVVTDVIPVRVRSLRSDLVTTALLVPEMGTPGIHALQLTNPSVIAQLESGELVAVELVLYATAGDVSFLARVQSLHTAREPGRPPTATLRVALVPSEVVQDGH